MGGKSGGSAPPPPDYKAQAAADLANQKEMLQAQTRANRVDQYGPQGSSTWKQDADGKWTQTVDAGDAGKNYQAQQSGLLGMSTAAAGALPGAIDKSLTHLDTSGLPDWQKFNMDPAGNSKSIQDATYALLQPQRQMARDSEIVRLKNQGLTEDSPAFQRAMLTLNQGDTDAQLKSLIAGQNEYGNQFSRATSANQLSNALRGNMLSEQATTNNYDLGQVKNLYGFGAGGNGGFQMPQFGNFSQQGAANVGTSGTDALNASYKAQMDAYNANQAKAGSAGKGLGGLLGAGASFLVPGGQSGALMGVGAGIGGGLLGGLF